MIIPVFIPVFNPETTDLEKSYLANPYSLGATTIVVKNANRFVVNDRILIGEMGTEGAEIVTLSAVGADNTTLTIGATLYAHSADDPVYKLIFDQVKFYKSTDGGSSYSVLPTQDLDVDNANLTTPYNDTIGIASDLYKFTFYHSIAAVESAFSDVIQGTGWRREQFGRIIDEFLLEVSDQNELNITRNEILGYANDVNDDLILQVADPYEFLHTRSALTRTANRNYMDFPTDVNGNQTMWKFDRMDYNYTDSTTSPVTNDTTTITVIPPEEFRNKYSDNTINSTTTSDTKPVAMTLDQSVNRFRFSHPATTTLANVFYLHYWSFFTTVDSQGDIIQTPTPKIYKLYWKAMYYQKRSVVAPEMSSIADKLMNAYLVEKSKYKMHDRKDQGTPRGFSIATATTKRFRR